MLHRRPRIGDKIAFRSIYGKTTSAEDKYMPHGIVKKLAGRICWTERLDNGEESCFIWMFKDRGITQMNTLAKIIESGPKEDFNMSAAEYVWADKI